MKKLIIIFFTFLGFSVTGQVTVSQLADSTKLLIGSKLAKADTVDLFSKRDTAKFAEGIRKSISSESTYELFSIISSSMTLTNESETMIRTIGTLTITLPVANTCYVDGKSKVFRITKGDGSTTLTIVNSAGTPLFVTANLNSTFVLVTNGTTWYNMNSGQ